MSDTEIKEFAQRMGVTESWLRYMMQADTFSPDHPMFARAWQDVPYGRAFPAQA